MLAARCLNAIGLNVMVDKQSRIQKLIESIISYLQAYRGVTYGVHLTLNKLVATDLSDKSFIDMPPQGTRHDEVLKNAIASIAAPELQEIANCLKAAKTIWSGAKTTPCSTHLTPIWVRGTRIATCILC